MLISAVISILVDFGSLLPDRTVTVEKGYLGAVLYSEEITKKQKNY